MTSTNRTASRKQVRARGMMGYRPLLEFLEDRITPSAIHWLGSPAAGGELWNVASNWQENRVPVSGDDLIFDTTTAGFSATTHGFNPSNNIVGLANLTITLNDAASSDFNLLGNAISLAAGGMTSNVSSGAGATLAMNAAMPATTTFDVAGAPLRIAGNLSGAGGLTVANLGTLVLQGTNTYAGPTSVNSGTLKAGSSFSTPNLVAVYGLNGNTNDSSTNALNGTIAGGGTSYVGGRFGQALNFTGSQSVRVPYNAAFALNTYTVSAWVKLNTAPGNFGVFGTRIGGDQTFGFKIQPNSIPGEVGTGTSWLNTTMTINQTVPAGSWHMITYAVDNAAQRAKLYYDGTLTNTFAFTGTPLFMTSGATVGIGQDYNNEFMNGAIDDVSIYGRALAGAEVAALFASSAVFVAIPGRSAVTVASGATLDLAGSTTLIGSLAGAGTVTSSVAGVTTLTTGADNSSTSFTGVIQNGAGTVGVTKIGLGTQMLTGANTYTGATTVSAGVLIYPPRIASASAATFQAGRSSSFSAVANGFPAATFSVTGALPAGVLLSPAGVLSGTPADDSAGVYPVTVTADNGIGVATSQAFTLTVITLPPTITSANAVTFVQDVTNTFAIIAAGAPIPTFSMVAGNLPSGVSLTPSGILSGMPAAGTAGTYPITVSASNGIGAPATQSFTLNVHNGMHWRGNSGTGGNLWNVPGNWQENDVPVSGDKVYFDTTAAGFSATPNGFNPVNNIAGLTNLTIAIDDASTAGDFNLSGNTIGLAAGGIASHVSSGAGATQSMNVTIPAPTTVAVVGAPLNFVGVLSGAGGLTVADSGTLILGGANTYTGPTVVSAGTLKLQPLGPSNIVAHYGLNGNANNDSPIPGLNGTINGSGTSYSAGPFGTALDFTGAQAVRIPYNAAFALNTFTVSAWVKLNTSPTTGGGVVSTSNGGSNDGTFSVRIFPTGALGDLGTGSNWLANQLIINRTVSLGSWHMITYVVDNAAQRATLYFDGVQSDTYTFNGVPLFMNEEVRL